MNIMLAAHFICPDWISIIYPGNQNMGNFLQLLQMKITQVAYTNYTNTYFGIFFHIKNLQYTDSTQKERL
jgi:hypothetical protein